MEADYMDTVLVNSLTVHVAIGCTAEERAFPQRLEFDLGIGITPNLDRPKGELSGTVCYATASSLIAEVAGSESWVLVEDLAESICSALFDEFPLAEHLRLCIRKRAVPHTAWTGIEVIRQRPTN